LSIGWLDLVSTIGSVLHPESTESHHAVVVKDDSSKLQVNAGRVWKDDGGNATFYGTNTSYTELNNIQFRHATGIVRTVAEVFMDNTARLRMTGCSFLTRAGTTSGDALKITTDALLNYISGNDFANWPVSLPAVIDSGDYGPNSRYPAYSKTPTASFATNGTFDPTYSGSITYYSFLGNRIVTYTTLIGFDANAYTGASGVFQINPGLPAKPETTSVAAIGFIQRVTWPADSVTTAELGTDGLLSLRSNTSGGGTTNLDTDAVPPNRASVIIRISGTFRYK